MCLQTRDTFLPARLAPILQEKHQHDLRGLHLFAVLTFSFPLTPREDAFPSLRQQGHARETMPTQETFSALAQIQDFGDTSPHAVR